jgi:hypothetical protein
MKFAVEGAFRFGGAPSIAEVDGSREARKDAH